MTLNRVASHVDAWIETLTTCGFYPYPAACVAGYFFFMESVFVLQKRLSLQNKKNSYGGSVKTFV